MEAIVPGWILERGLPQEVIAGIATGEHTIHGGVVRWAAGTGRGGQIVRHILPVAGDAVRVAGGDPLPIANMAGGAALKVGQMVQLHRMAKDVAVVKQATQQILQLSTATMALSGLNLTVAAIGFRTLQKKMTGLETLLREIQNDVKEIKQILQQDQRAQLRAALSQLVIITPEIPDDHRKTILTGARDTLNQVHQRHMEQYREAEDASSALAFEEYFCLTAIARARCSAELGMFDIALTEISDDVATWTGISRRVAGDMLIRDSPERFMDSDFVKVAPTASIVSWLDFADNTTRGYEWVDDMRDNSSHVGRFIGRVRRQPVPFMGGRPESETVVPALNRLVSRDDVLAGYVGQYETMKDQEITPSDFEGRLAVTPEGELTDGYAILRPAAEE